MKKYFFKKILLILSFGFILLGNNLVFAVDDIALDSISGDKNPPVMSLIGPSSITLTQGDTYTEEGATAVDLIDGEVEVFISGEVNTKIAKDYTVTYNSSDSSGNLSSIIRIVKVLPISSANIHLDIVASDKVLFSQDMEVSSCEEVLGSDVYTVNGYCAVSQSNLESDWSWYDDGAFLNSIESYSNNNDGNGIYWGWFSNLDLGGSALNKYILNNGDRIIINYDINPLKISVDNSSPTVGDIITISVSGFKYDENFNPTWVPSSGGSIVVGDNIFLLDSNGQYNLKILGTEVLGIIGKKEGFIDTESLIIEPVPSKSNIFIRNGDQIIYEGIYDIPSEGFVSISDSNGNLHEINKRSVLSIVKDIDIISDHFSIPSFEYNSDFDSLYLKCLITSNLENLCDNWQYVVGGNYPFVGMDKNILNDTLKIYIYFGPQNKISLSSNSINTNDVLTVNTQKYNYEKNIWESRSGVTVGVTKPNPLYPFSPDDSINASVDNNGVVTFSTLPVGVYDVGVKEDYYWPTEKLTVALYSPDNGGGSSGSDTDIDFSVSKALDFLNKNKDSDGSYGGSMYTDWVAIAASAGGNSNLKSTLASYLKDDSIDSSVITDYERRAMALMALGINPYTGTEINYIEKILESFDGNQFGEQSLINDDIFAVIVLKNAGYDSDDDIIIKSTEHIVSQQSNGSWGSIDITAAGVQALEGLEDIDGVSDAVSDSISYLISAQGLDGGFGNSFSTSWVLQILSDNNLSSKAKKYLSDIQQLDGGLLDLDADNDMRIWATAYSIPAILQKSWDDILNNFSKHVPKEIEKESNKGVVSEVEDTNTPILIKEIENIDVEQKIDKAVSPINQKVKSTSLKIDKISEEEVLENTTFINKENSESDIVIQKENYFVSVLNQIWAIIKGLFSWFLVRI